MKENPTPFIPYQLEYVQFEKRGLMTLRLPNGMLLALPYYREGASFSLYESQVMKVLSGWRGNELMKEEILDNQIFFLPLGKYGGKYGVPWRAIGRVRLTQKGEPVYILSY